MSKSTVAAMGAILGLTASGAILTLLAFGVSGVLATRSVDLMYVFWPASILLTSGWRTTLDGVTITATCVVVNCAMWACVFLAFRFVAMRGWRVIVLKSPSR